MKRQTNEERARALDEQLTELRKLEAAVTDAEGIAWREIVRAVVDRTEKLTKEADPRPAMVDVRQALATLHAAEIDRDAFKATLAKRFSAARTRKPAKPNGEPAKRGRKPKAASATVPA